MAKVIEENLVIRVSKLVRDSSEESLVPDEALRNLEQVTQELLGDTVIVEVKSEFTYSISKLFPTSIKDHECVNEFLHNISNKPHQTS